MDRTIFSDDHKPMAKKPAGEKAAKLGLLVRKLRIEKRLTQEEFADHAGIDRSYQGKIERGEAAISFEKLDLIAQKLGLKDWELLKKLAENGG